MGQRAGLLCAVLVPRFNQYISGQRSHLDVAVYIAMLDCASVVFVHGGSAKLVPCSLSEAELS